MSRASRSGGGGDFVLLAVSGAVSLLALVLPDAVREPWAGGMRRSIVAPLVALQSRAQLSRAAILAHDSTTLRTDSLVMQALTARALAGENQRLRRLLGLAQQLRWGFVPAEALRGRSTREDFSLTLTAGSNAGIARFSPVVAPEGLVGMVQSVDPTLSTAITFSHPDFRVSAMTADGSAFGIVAAHLGEGAERYMLAMRGVPFRTTLARGTLVLSSGLGGTYPRGVPIGVVQGELETAEGWARSYLIRPAVLPPDIGSVMVLTPQRVVAGVANVWASQASLDSAVRAVAAAGDSIAASDSALARSRRQMDSTARAAAARAAAPAGAAGAAASPPDSAPRPVTPVRGDSTRRAPRRAAPVVRPPATDTARRPAVPMTPQVPDTARPGARR